jgi:hypothetical protein
LPDLLDATPLWAIGVLLLALLTAAYFGGRRMRAYGDRRAAASGGSKKSEFGGYIVSAMLGLLSLLLGFTFSLATQRFEQRRQLVIEEANAIGTADLRVQILDSPYRETLRRLFREHVSHEIGLADIGYPATGSLRAEDDRIQGQIWATAAAAIAPPKLGPYALFLSQPINGMIDLNASRRAVRATEVPAEVFIVLLAYLIGIAGVLGYEIGPGRATFIACFVLALMSLALLLIMDIDRPAAGGIREAQGPMEQLRLKLGTGPMQAPAP